MNSYLLFEPNNALHAFTTALELQFQIFVSMGKIDQNVKFLSVHQNSDLISKLDCNRQHESRGMFSFQSRALDTKLLKFHVNRDERAYLDKRDF